VLGREREIERERRQDRLSVTERVRKRREYGEGDRERREREREKRQDRLSLTERVRKRGDIEKEAEREERERKDKID